MKKIGGALIILLMVGLVIASGCMGGGGSETSSTSSQAPSTASSYSTTQSSMTTTSSAATSSQSTTTSTTSPTSTSSSSTTSSPSPTETTTTTSPSEELYWTNPWEYSTVNVNGEQYKVVYYKALYKVQPNQSSPVYEYIIEKKVDKTKIHVYGIDAMGNKKDIGEKEVYEYITVVTPKKAAEMRDKVTIRIWYKNEAGDSFIYPWEIGWASSMYGGSGGLVGFQIEYMGDRFTFTNPMAYGESLFPYMDGNTELLDEIGTDLTNLWMGWFAVIQIGIWSAWQDENLAVPRSGTWSDGMHVWEWSTKPDGTVTFSGVTFKVVDAQWSYTGAPEGVSLNGKAKVAPKLFLPLEVEGHFSFVSSDTGEKETIYGYIKIEDLKLEKVS